MFSKTRLVPLSVAYKLRVVKFGTSSARLTNTKENSNAYEEKIKNQILAASLQYVQQHGWSKEALVAGANSLGYPGISHGMFSRGGGDLVLYFQKSSNTEIYEFMKKFSEDPANKNIAPAEFVEIACKERLSMTIPYLNHWPQAIAIMSLPPNVPTALATLLTMVDDICYFAGDRSTDFSWYARRIGVASVYKTSELYLLQDKSPDYTKTWAFLHRCLRDAQQLHEIISSKSGSSSIPKDAISGAFTTARNILGLNKAV